jgi:putative transposase
MSFHEIDDNLWESIEPYLPPQKPQKGRPRSDLRNLMNGILYVGNDRLYMEKRSLLLWL